MISSRTVAGPAAGRARCRGPGAGRRPAVDLAVGGQRQRVQHHDRGRDHVVRQPGRREPAHRRAGHAARPSGPSAPAGPSVGRPAACPRGVLADGDHGLGHRRVGGQHRLDLARLDPEPADLDLVIGPPQRTPARPSAVHRARSPVRYIRSPDPNGHATNRSPVSAGRPAYPRANPRPGHVQLPRHPGRDRRQPPVQHEHPRVATGRPIGGPAVTPAPPGSGPLVATTPSSRSARTRCTIRRPRRRTSAATSSGPHASPPTISTARPGPDQPHPTLASAVGDDQRMRSPAAPAAPRPAPHRPADQAAAPPAPHPAASASTAPAPASKPARRELQHPRPAGHRRTGHAPPPRTRQIPACVTTTPFGEPVDPEV